MERHKIKTEEAHELAWKEALKVWGPTQYTDDSKDFDDCIAKAMRRYDQVMEAILRYNESF